MGLFVGKGRLIQNLDEFSHCSSGGDYLHYNSICPLIRSIARDQNDSMRADAEHIGRYQAARKEIRRAFQKPEELQYIIIRIRRLRGVDMNYCICIVHRDDESIPVARLKR